MHAQTTALGGLVVGSLGIAVASFFTSGWLYLALIPVSAVGLFVIHRLRMRKAARWEDQPLPAPAALLPTTLAALSLVVYAAIVAMVHSHAFGIAARHFTSRVTSEQKVMEQDTRQLDRLAGGLPTIAKALFTEMVNDPRLESEVAAADRTPNRILATLKQVRTYNVGEARTFSQLNDFAQVALKLNAEMMQVDTVRAPSPNKLPSWFGHLQGLLETGAQVLAGLLVALVFSRRRSRNRQEDALLRVAMPFALVGLLAALVGSAPAVPATVQAFLLAYVIAGVIGSATSVGLIAADIVR